MNNPNEFRRKPNLNDVEERGEAPLGRVSRSPDHLFDPSGLTVGEVRDQLLRVPVTHKIWVESSDDDPTGEGTLLGEVVEIQDGRDGVVYLRIRSTQARLRDNLAE